MAKTVPSSKSANWGELIFPEEPSKLGKKFGYL